MSRHRWKFGVFVLLAWSIVAGASCGADSVSGTTSVSVATITAEPTRGQAPLEVSLTAEPSGGEEPYEATWSFGRDSGDGATGLETTHTFYRQGVREAVVHVTDAAGDTAQKAVEIAVEPAEAPTVTATASPQMGTAPLETTFEASVDGGAGAYAFAWKFGDGGSSDKQNPAHRYVVGGAYDVSVTVTDTLTGKEATAQVSVEVADDQTPFVSATADPARGIAPLNVAFGGQTSGGNEPLSYSWDFGDDSAPADGLDPSHEYTDPGLYKAVLTVEDADGDVDHSEVTVEALDNAVPSVDIFADPTGGIAPLTVQFDPQAQGGDVPLMFEWDFGNADTADTRKPSYRFTEPGTHTITVTATDANGDTSTDTVDIDVTSDDVPSVTATATPTTGLAPLQIQFDATASGGNGDLSYAWNFGEGSTGTAEDPVHTYQVAGQYTATVTVRDANGDTASETIDLDVSDNLTPAANASATPTTGRAPLTADFFANATGGNGALSYAWDFGDGSQESAQTPTHTFNTPGTYQVSLVVTDGDGSSNQSTVTIEVIDNAEPAVEATASPTTGIAPINIDFNATATAGDPPFSYTWDFGDNSAAQTVESPDHSYTAGGSYTATVTVTDDDGDTASDTVDIDIADNEVPAVTGATDNDTGTAPFTVDFTTNATGGNTPLTYTWYFGDGSVPVTGPAPSHTYQNVGVYEATVVATDADGDTAQDTMTIYVQPVAPDLTIDSITITPSVNITTFEVTVRNNGADGVNNDFLVGLHIDDGQPPTSTSTPNNTDYVFQDLLPGESATSTLISRDLPIGVHEAYAFVDRERDSADFNRNNNIYGPVSFTVDYMLVNEIYYDTPGADDVDQTFVEVYGVGGKDVSGYVLKAVNGSDGQPYDTFTLPQGTTLPANGLLVIGSANNPEADVSWSGVNLQNGPDNVVVESPSGNQLDAVGYGDFSAASDHFVGERDSTMAVTTAGQSLGRNLAFSDTDNNEDDFFTWTTPTPGEPNRAGSTTNPDTCSEAIDLNGGTEGHFYIEANLGDATNTYTSRPASGSQTSCSPTSTSFAGPDQIVKITVPSGQTADVETDLDDNADIDIDLVATAAPCSSLATGFLGCSAGSRETFTLSAGTYYFIVLEDGGNNDASSDEPYTLTVDVDFQ